MTRVKVQLKIRPDGELTEVDDSEIPGLVSSGFLTQEAAAAAAAVMAAGTAESKPAKKAGPSPAGPSGQAASTEGA